MTDEFAPQTPEENKRTETLYDKTPSSSTTESKEFYPITNTLQSVFDTRAAELADVVGLTTEQRVKDEKEFIETIRQPGLDPYAVGQPLYTRWVDALLAEAQGLEEPDLHQDNEQVRAELASVYGRKEAEDLLARAHKFTKQFPKLHAILGTRGIGSRRDVVIPIVEHVRRVNFR